MVKTGTQYAAEVRALRSAGFDFPAGRGYRLHDATNWSSGLKSAVTKAFTHNKRSIAAKKGAATRRERAAFNKRSTAAKKGAATRRERARKIEQAPRRDRVPADIGGGGGGPAPSQEFAQEDDTEIGREFFADAAGDEFEEWDDIDYFDFDEGEELFDEEGDDYDED